MYVVEPLSSNFLYKWSELFEVVGESMTEKEFPRENDLSLVGVGGSKYTSLAGERSSTVA